MRDATGDEATTTAIAAELKVTPARVRQIEALALRKCRDYCASHGYRLEDLIPDTPRKNSHRIWYPIVA